VTDTTTATGSHSSRTRIGEADGTALVGVNRTSRTEAGVAGSTFERGRVFMNDSDVRTRMSGLAEDIDAIAAAGDYDDTDAVVEDAVVEDAVRELLRRRPELRVSLAVEKYRAEAVSLNRAAELAGLSTVAFRDELADRGVDRDAGFLRDSHRESQLETFSE